MKKRGRPPHPLNFSFANLPELELFETNEQREAALLAIGWEFGNPRKIDWWIGVGTVVAAVIGSSVLLRFVLRAVDWPGWVEDTLRMLLMIACFLLVLRALHRWGARGDLRRQLLKVGVPVCLGCGYSLRGLGADSPRCPECGRLVDERVRELLRAEKGSITSADGGAGAQAQ